MSEVVNPTGDRRPGQAFRHGPISIRTVFYTVLFVVLIVYMQMAFQMDWVTAGGRIGPGFFPRIVGSLAVVVCAGALLHSIRMGAVQQEDDGFDEDELGDGDLGRHPVATAIAVAASFAFLIMLTSLGAIIAAAVFLFVMLFYLNRGRWVTNIVLALTIPIGMYLLFQTALNAGLPSGILPRF